MEQEDARADDRRDREHGQHQQERAQRAAGPGRVLVEQLGPGGRRDGGGGDRRVGRGDGAGDVLGAGRSRGAGTTGVEPTAAAAGTPARAPMAVASRLLNAALVATRASGAGRGSFSAAAMRPWPSSAAVERSAGSGRPARSMTAASGPSSADTGIRRSSRFMSVATVVSPANGTSPVTASTSTRASE